jgi:glutaredoxin
MNTKTKWLIILVLSIWGTIGYKFYKGRDSEGMPETARVIKKVDNLSDTKDNYPLAFNYKDPFLKKEIEKNQVQKAVSVIKKNKPVISVPNIIIQWENVEYMGFIFNASRNIKLASLRINGIEYMGKQDELVEGFKIERITSDSIQLSYGSQFKYITKRR